MSDKLNIIIGGEAGQGLVTIGQILSKSLIRAGYSIVVNQGYQSRIRGGHNTFEISVSTEDISAPPPEPESGNYDILIGLDERSCRQAYQSLTRNDDDTQGLLIMDSAFADIVWKNALKVPYKQLATGKFQNTAALGVISAILHLDEELVANAVNDSFGKHPEAIEDNRKVLSASYAWAKDQISAGVLNLSKCILPTAPARSPRLMMNGNEAIALGALSAGLKFCSFYPMTPATSVVLNLTANAKRMGIIAEQAEDEISAINMAIAASYAGAPSMTATSGGGFALMVEGVSLAGMIETPVVVVLAQRPGPATGMPTRTEQGDLELALYAGHGEFPRAIFAPGSVEECFHLTRKAFDIAERSQGPVFVLTDQFLADSYRAVEPFDVENLEPVKACVSPDEVEEPYLRYRFTESGISPRLMPGAPKHLVIADSDEHTEDGHLTEDENDHLAMTTNVKGETYPLSIRVRMTDKRLRKNEFLKSEVVPPDYIGDESPDVLLVSWGSTRGAVEESVEMMKKDGKKAAMLHFSQVWPLVPEQFMSRLQSAGKVVFVEGNATGQFARTIRAATGFHTDHHIHRYDGLQINSGYVCRGLVE
ncbi:MAG: 2-oxoacid:acceptor oxidoreductase subunit alpha [Armatimonadota bacterium]